MNLLFSIDDNYLRQLETTLLSIRVNNFRKPINIYVLQKERLTQATELEQFCDYIDVHYVPIIINDNRFENAPVRKHWSEAIYYRLLAHEYLPESVKDILYLDADILCINDMSGLFEIDSSNYLYAAASHNQLTRNVTEPFNKVRLGNYEAESYFNSGVLLMNLNLLRETVKTQDIFDYIEANKMTIMLPDQDVLNGLYGDKTLIIPDEIYNYDARFSVVYELISVGDWDLDWVIRNTVFIHYCGKIKPWDASNRSKLSLLYKHYNQLAERIISEMY